MPTSYERLQELAALEDLAQMIAQRVGPAFDGSGAGFAVLGFEFGSGGWSTYVSNARREDMIRALREMADHLEQSKDTPRRRPFVQGAS